MSKALENVHPQFELQFFPSLKTEVYSEMLENLRPYLANHYRIDPMTTLHLGSSQSLVPTIPALCWHVNKRTALGPNFFQFSKETA
jgi:hypothetical protein